MKIQSPIRLKKLRQLSDRCVIRALECDASDVVRHEAAFILGERMQGKTLEYVESAFKAICIASIFDASILVRHETALALVHFGSYDSRRFLQLLLSDKAKEVRDSALYAIEELSLI